MGGNFRKRDPLDPRPQDRQHSCQLICKKTHTHTQDIFRGKTLLLVVIDGVNGGIVLTSHSGGYLLLEFVSHRLKGKNNNREMERKRESEQAAS